MTSADTFVARVAAARAAYEAARAARAAAYQVAFDAAYAVVKAECKTAGIDARRSSEHGMTVAQRKSRADGVVTAFVIGDYSPEFAARFATVADAAAAYVEARRVEDETEAAWRAARVVA